ncbi:MAG: hypothetical protein J6D29_03670 [Solobacterium sp.]|nr:hypothetical protein [Solobacterium sp.]
MITIEDLDVLEEDEFAELERRIETQIAIWEIKNLRGRMAIFHDDQHIGEPRLELKAIHHPSFDVEGEMNFRKTPVVDSLEGNMLIHPITTPIIEVNKDNSKARGLWWSIGIEGLSKFRETPMAIWSVGMIPGVHVKEKDGWKILSGMWQRTTKNEFHAGWVEDMQPTNTRPQISKEEDRARLGKYAYQKNEKRKSISQPPYPDTWEKYPDELDQTWQEMK